MKIRSFVQIAMLLLLLLAFAFAQGKTKRLILKDGSFQPATKWEIKGERVRYFSSERYMWEELPKSLVDWLATEQYEREMTSATASAKSGSPDADEAAELRAEEARSPTIAPGVRLPETGGVFLADSHAAPLQLIELEQNSGEINQQRGKNILRSVINPLPSGPRQTVELKGAHARVQIHDSKPTIYVNLNEDGDQIAAAHAEEDVDPLAEFAPKDRYRIVRLKRNGKVRVVGNLKISLLGKNIKEQQDSVATASSMVSMQWIQVTPAEPLPPGEYALVEMLSPKQMNMYVWDFGIDSGAPSQPALPQSSPSKPKPAAH